MNIKLSLEYDGTRYHGWQLQPGKETIQAVLEGAIEKILGAATRVNGSGRTDAGVHALAQVANFFYSGNIDPVRLQKGVNALTPEDIVVKRAEAVPDSFDARRSALSRIYRYQIWNQPSPSAFYGRFSWHVYGSLDFPAMQSAIRQLEGEHDFSSFQGSGGDSAHAVRRVLKNSLSWEDPFWVYAIEANAFLRHMVRNIVGTLVEVGRQQRRPESFAELLSARDRTRAGPTAPPHGLFLVEVKYETG